MRERDNCGLLIGDISLVARALRIIDEFGPSLGTDLNLKNFMNLRPSGAENVHFFPNKIIPFPNRGAEL